MASCPLLKGTVLLTGATGFLGSHLLKTLLSAGYKVVVLKRTTSNNLRIINLLDQVTIYNVDRVPLTRAFEDQHIDCVMHTACHYGRNDETAQKIVETNLIFGLQLLDAATFFNTSIFINTDTFLTKATDKLLKKNLTNYTLSKKQFVQWLYQRSDLIQVVNLKLEHMYGPQDNSTKFVPWLISQLAQNVPHINLTQGEQLRDFIYVDDVVTSYMIILQESAQLESFNEFDVGTGTLTSVRKIVEMLKDAFVKQHDVSRTQLNFGAIPYQHGEMMQVEVNNAGLIQLGWRPTTELFEGLRKTINSLGST